jgi:hypothetical protein
VQGGVSQGALRLAYMAPRRHDTIFEWECDSIRSYARHYMYLYGFFDCIAGFHAAPRATMLYVRISVAARRPCINRALTVHVKACAPAPRPRVEPQCELTPSARAGFRGRVPVRLS